MSGEPVIDLGLLEPAPRAARDRGWAGWSGRRRRAATAWSTAALVLVLAAGSGSPPVLPVSVPAPVDGRFEVIGELLFVAVSRQRAYGHPGPAHGSSSFDWTAHDLSTGEPLWTLKGLGDRLDLVAVDGLLWDGGFPLDPATGRWLSPKGSSVPGGYRYLGVPGGETVVVSGGYRPYSDAAVDLEFTYEVMGVDAATGVVRWRDDPDPGVRVWLDGDPARVVTIASDELVSIRDPDTGAVLASRRIPNAISAQLLGGELLVRVWTPGGVLLRAFARDSMRPLWDSPEPAGSLAECGDMLCVHAQPDGGRTVVDAMTGDRWRVPRRTEVIDPATGAPAWATAHRLYPLGGRFLAYDNQGGLRAVLDARTGRMLRDLAGWQAVVPPANHGHEPGPVTLLRTGPAGDIQLARLDPAAGGLTEVGQLPARPTRCQPYRDGVACLHADRVWVWPLP